MQRHFRLRLLVVDMVRNELTGLALSKVDIQSFVEVLKGVS